MRQQRRQRAQSRKCHSVCSPWVLALRRQDDAVQLFRPSLEVVWRANVIATVRRGLMYNFGLRHGNPGPVDLHLIMSIDGPAGSWTTVGEVATRAFAVGSL